MLKKIIINNFTTFIKKTDIDFSATNYKFLSDENINNGVTKGTLFVGENASGKTNTLEAINFLIDLVARDTHIIFSRYKSFYSDKSTYGLSYYFQVDNSEIVYDITLNPSGVAKEKLIKDSETIMERKNKKAYLYLHGEDERIEYDVPLDLAFLRQWYFSTRFAFDSILKKWCEFITNSVYIDCYCAGIAPTKEIGRGLSKESYLDKHGVDEINNFFKAIHYNEDIIYADTTPSAKSTKVKFSHNDKFVAFRKKGTDVYIPEIFESTGNVTLINILPAFLHAIKHNSMIIVNEFSSGLHNDLEEALIKFFFHYAKKSQLFFTSHSTNLLNNSILRPDQIYSVRFDYQKGGSILSRFSDQNPREAQNTEKMYLNGVFDEVPHYNKFFQD